MRDTLRIRMGWMHGWVGFLAGLALLVVFATGTLSVFDVETGRWMEPEIAPRELHAPTDAALASVRQAWEGLRAQGVTAFLNLPSARDPVLRLQHFDGHEFVGPAFDPQTGAALNARPTVGRTFFYDIHYSLHLGHDWGRRVVDLLGLALLVTIGSGVIIHLRALLPDLLVFRPFASFSRAWMDAHVLAGVAFLPFLTTVAFTGVVIHAGAIFPDARRPAHDRAGHAQPPPLPALAPLLARSATALGPGPLGFLMSDPQHVSVVRADGAGFLLSRAEARFSYGDGRFLGVSRQEGAVAVSQQAFRGAHFARWAPLGLRWLYFLSGAAASALTASGLILFLTRHRRHHAQTHLFRIAEALTMTVIAGLPTAALGLFWSNRLIPVGMPARLTCESATFFGLWLFALLHALTACLIGRANAGWRQQLSWIAALGLALPVLDTLTRGGWWHALGPNVFTAVDLVAVGVGAGAALAVRKLSLRAT